MPVIPLDRPNDRPNTAQVGIASGRNRYSQFAGDEYVSDLRGLQAVRTYYRMLAGDPLVAGLLTAVKLPIIAAGWNINPAKSRGAGPNERAPLQARKDADLVTELLMEELGQCWEDEVRQLLGYLAYGFHVAALNWELRDGQAVLYELRHIHPREILQNYPHWEFDDRGQLAGAWQTGFTEKGTQRVFIPADSLIYLAHDAEYGRMEGMSILRPCYKPWFATEELYRFGLIGAERAAVGVPIGRYPSNASEEQKDAFEAALLGLATYEKAALVMQNGPEGERYEVDNFQVEVKMDVLTPQITHHNAQMTKRFLAGFLNLGQEGAGGAYALSADQTDLFMVSLQAVADYLAARINRVIIPKLVDYNRGPRQRYPEIGASISRTTAAAMANLIATASKTGLLTLGDADEDAFREYAELPPRSVDRPQPGEQQPGTGQPGAPPQPGTPQPPPAQDTPQDQGFRRRERIELFDDAQGGHFVSVGGHVIFISDSGEGKAGSPRADGKEPTEAQAGGKGLARPGFHPASDEERKQHKVPPGWHDVHVADDPNARLAAVGRDAAGRQQPRYSAAHTEAALRQKFERGRLLHTAMPGILAHTESEVAGGKNATEAAVVRLIAHTGARVGGDEDTGAKVKAYGASTLEARHVTIKGETATLDFPGKKGKQNLYTVTDPAIVADLKARTEGADPGARLFPTNDTRTINYLRRAAGGQKFKTHDLRTRKATATALEAVHSLATPQNPAEYWQRRDQAGQRAADQINDTLDVALGSYVDPLIFEGWRIAAGVGENDERPKQPRKQKE